MSLITSGIHIGSLSQAKARYSDFDFILNVSESSLSRYRNIRSDSDTILVEIPFEDSEETDLTKYLPYTNAVLKQAHNDGLSILVNCQRGISRSVSVVIGFLISKGMTFDEAYDLVRKKRPKMNPNPEFERALRSLGKH